MTADELVVLPPVTVEIFHPYSDMPEEGIEVLAYDYVEAFAEKFRALAERTRPRDLYDVVNLYRNTDARPEQQQFVQVLREKCVFKGIELPRLADLQPHRAAVEAGWVHMLSHQPPGFAAGQLILGGIGGDIRLAAGPSVGCTPPGHADKRSERTADSGAHHRFAARFAGAVLYRDHQICGRQPIAGRYRLSRQGRQTIKAVDRSLFVTSFQGRRGSPDGRSSR